MIKWPAVAVGRTSKKSLAAFGRALKESARVCANHRTSPGWCAVDFVDDELAEEAPAEGAEEEQHEDGAVGRRAPWRGRAHEQLEVVHSANIF